MVNLLFLAPAINTSSDRMFSVLKQIKTFMRNWCGQVRRNHLMSLHIYRDDIDILDL